MTTRIKGFAVALTGDLRADDAEEIRRALSMVRGVVSVDVVEGDASDWMNREMVRHELTAAIFAALRAGKREA